MRDGRPVSDGAIESVLRQSEHTLRRSRQVLAAAAETVDHRDRWLSDIDEALVEARTLDPDVLDLRDEVDRGR